MTTGDDKWKFFFGFNNELPSEEDLKTIKTIIFPGSGHSVYDESVSWIPGLKDFIRRIFNEYPQIKMIGGCFGEQVTAQAMGGRVEKMPRNEERPKCLGREHIQLTDEFFEQPFVKKYMAKTGLTRETFPNMVLQESHGDHVAELPEGATLLGTSESCKVEIYCIGDRALNFQSHPDFNCGFQQELSEPEYYINGFISEEYHQKAFLKCADTSLGLESRNLALGLMREFIKHE